MDSIEKKRLFWTRVTALATVSLLVVVLATIVGMAIQWNALQEDFEHLNSMVDTMNDLADNLTAVSKQLSQIEWEDLARNINQTAEKAQAGMDAAITAIDSLDIATLNEAIAALRDIIEPLARFFNVFR
ncbi:MAG: hypothetical protein ACOX1U_03235 [Saccharofermentanales bacterium]|jgi:predicted PurR-regulated permease PerM